MESRARGDGIPAMDTIRHATDQLNFLYQNRPPDGSYTYRERLGQKEIHEYLSWGCPRTQASWVRLISHWESTPQQANHLLDWLEHCASHRVLRILPKVIAMLFARYLDDIDQFTTAWKTIWEIAGDCHHHNALATPRQQRVSHCEYPGASQ